MELYVGNVLSGFDFNPHGETMATIDYYGLCLISDINTDSYRFHLNLEKLYPYGKSYLF